MFSENDKIYKAEPKSLLEIARGEYTKRVLVVMQEEPAYPGNLEFVKKILGAAGLDLEKDTLFAPVVMSESALVLPALKTKHPDQVLVFGLVPAQLGLNIQASFYKPVSFLGTTFLFAEKLSVIESDKSRKTGLWQALRQIFL